MSVTIHKKIKIPMVLTDREVKVVTRKKLTKHPKPIEK